MELLETSILYNIFLDYLKKNYSQYFNNLKCTDITLVNSKISNKYIEYKKNIAKELNIKFITSNLSGKIESEIIKEIEKNNKDESVNGILIQLPLPEIYNCDNILNAINIKKDIDSLNTNSLFDSPVSLSIDFITNYFNISLDNKIICIIGNGKLIGRPLLRFLSNKYNSTFFLIHKEISNYKEIIKQSDVVIVGIGQPNYLDSKLCNKNAFIIDCGFSIIDDVSYGDVNYKSFKNRKNLIIPFRNGIGKITILFLFLNMIKYYNDYSLSKKAKPLNIKTMINDIIEAIIIPSPTTEK